MSPRFKIEIVFGSKEKAIAILKKIVPKMTKKEFTKKYNIDAQTASNYIKANELNISFKRKNYDSVFSPSFYPTFKKEIPLMTLSEFCKKYNMSTSSAIKINAILKQKFLSENLKGIFNYDQEYFNNHSVDFLVALKRYPLNKLLKHLDKYKIKYFREKQTVIPLEEFKTKYCRNCELWTTRKSHKSWTPERCLVYSCEYFSYRKKINYVPELKSVVIDHTTIRVCC